MNHFLTYMEHDKAFDIHANWFSINFSTIKGMKVGGLSEEMLKDNNNSSFCHILYSLGSFDTWDILQIYSAKER